MSQARRLRRLQYRANLDPGIDGAYADAPERVWPMVLRHASFGADGAPFLTTAAWFAIRAEFEALLAREVEPQAAGVVAAASVAAERLGGGDED